MKKTGFSNQKAKGLTIKFFSCNLGLQPQKTVQCQMGALPLRALRGEITPFKIVGIKNKEKI